MMKFGGGGGFFAPSSMLLFLFLFFFMAAQISDAVQCLFSNRGKVGDDGNAILETPAVKSCEACVLYACNGNSGIFGFGCPEDFYRQCSGYSRSTDYVKYYNPKKACYTDGTTLYISGCEKEDIGGACLDNNIVECTNMIKDAKKDGYGTPAYPFYNGSNGIDQGVWKLSGMILLGWILARFY